MNNLLEKLKTVDKKILIGAGVGIAAVIILIIALIVGGGSKPAGNDKNSGSQNGTQKGTETEDGATEVFGETENLLGTEALGTEMGTELGTEMGTELATELTTEVTMPETQIPESQVPESQAPTVPESQAPTVPESQAPAVNPEGEEILGAGSAAQPYMEIPNLDNMTVTTVAVPAGQTLYYGIQRVGGMWLTINDPNAYVITSNGTRYDAKNGKVSFKVEDALASDYVIFQIGNKGGAPASFTIKFSNIKGTYQNPEDISSVGSYALSLSAGNEVGYYYKYYAQQTGILRFYIRSATATSSISVTNNSQDSANRTLEADAKTDEWGNTYVELEVNQGDEIMISICAVPDRRFKYPASDVTWEMLFQ